jgi:formate hydrogenlyase subunit 3/multisubunit Na+/H+ antiporter MnhD subunit
LSKVKASMMYNEEELNSVFSILTALATLCFGYHIPTMKKGNKLHLAIGILTMLVGLVGLVLSSKKLHSELR